MKTKKDFLIILLRNFWVDSWVNILYWVETRTFWWPGHDIDLILNHLRFYRFGSIGIGAVLFKDSGRLGSIHKVNWRQKGIFQGIDVWILIDTTGKNVPDIRASVTGLVRYVSPVYKEKHRILFKFQSFNFSFSLLQIFIY